MARMAGPTASGAWPWPSVSSRSVRGTALPWPFSSLSPSPCSCFMQFIWPVVLSYLNVTNGLFMIAIIVFAGLLGLLLSMMMRRQQTREQAHERMLKRERQEQHAQTLDYAAQVHDRISGRLANISMICSRHIGERNAADADSRDAEDWRLVASQVADSLADAYSIIELMSGIQWRGSTTRSDAVSVDRLRRLCDALREELAGKGFHGGFALTTMDSWKTSTPII